jgi:hypothetical protein
VCPQHAGVLPARRNPRRFLDSILFDQTAIDAIAELGFLRERWKPKYTLTEYDDQKPYPHSSIDHKSKFIE